MDGTIIFIIIAAVYYNLALFFKADNSKDVETDLTIIILILLAIYFKIN